VSCVAVSVSVLKSSTWSERRRNCAHHIGQLSCRATIARSAIVARHVNNLFSTKNGLILKFAYYRNYCNNSNEILHSHKHHQVSFAGSLNMRITNPTWRTAAILEKSKNRQISATAWKIVTQLGTMMEIHPPDAPDSYRFQILTIQYGDCRHLRKVEKLPYQRNSLTNRNEIWHCYAVPPSWRVRQLKLKKIKIQNGGDCHLAKSKNRHMSATVLPIAMKFSILTQFNPLEATVKFNFFLNPRWRQPPSWKIEIAIFRQWFGRLPRNLARWRSLTLKNVRSPWPFQQLAFRKFKNSWRQPPSWKIEKSLYLSPQRFDRSPRNLARWRRLAILSVPSVRV